MYYTKEMIEKLGYLNVKDFAIDTIKCHKNCIITNYNSDGIYISYDLDSEAGLPWIIND